MSKIIRTLRGISYELVSVDAANKLIKSGETVYAFYMSERHHCDGVDFHVIPLAYYAKGTKKGITVYGIKSTATVGTPLSEKDFSKYQTEKNVSNFVKNYVQQTVAKRVSKKTNLDEDQIQAVYTLSKHLPYDQWKNLLTDVVKAI